MLQDFNPFVGYLHRTVQEFIEREDVRTKFQSSLNSPFDANISLFKSYLIQLKTQSFNLGLNANSFWVTVTCGMRYAITADPKCSSFQFQALERINETASMLYLQNIASIRNLEPLVINVHYYSGTVDSSQPHFWAAIYPGYEDCKTFLHFAVQNNFKYYIKAAFTRLPTKISKVDLDRLLYCALLESMSLSTWLQISNENRALPDLELIEILLDSGADPQVKILGKTIRQNLDEMIKESSPDDREAWSEIRTLLMNYEAKNTRFERSTIEQPVDSTEEALGKRKSKRFGLKWLLCI